MTNEIPNLQQETISSYESNGWNLTEILPESGIAVLNLTEIMPESGKELHLKAYIDPDGSSRIG